MYKSYVYLEVRVLLSAVPGVFIVDGEQNEARDILTAKAEFQDRNNNARKVSSVSIEPAALRKVVLLSRAVGAQVLAQSELEHLTANIQEPPDDRNYTGFSVKIAEGGSLDIMFHQKAKTITIEEIRIEENSGHLTRGKNQSQAHMDWTYAGCPCMRLKTSASFEVGEEAELFLQELYTLMAYLKLVLGELGESSFRANAYVAIGTYPHKPSYLVKLRNLNSFNFARNAINTELTRQEDTLSSGGTLHSESRLWIEERHTTEPWHLRGDCVAHFDKVTPKVTISIASPEEHQNPQVELPAARRQRLRKLYGLSRLRAEFICGEKDRADYFEACLETGAPALQSARWMAGELMKLLNAHKTSIRQTKLTAQRFGRIMKMLNEGKIFSPIAKEVMQDVFTTGEEPEDVLERRNLIMLSTDQEILPFVNKVLEQNPASVQSLKNGQMAPLEHLTGCVMKECGGRASPATIKAIIKNRLQISVIYVLAMGGAISASKEADGTVTAGKAENIRSLLDTTAESFPVQIEEVAQVLSEETEPADWAALIEQVKLKIESGIANGIVITHGTDTLPYTASLMFWLFGGSSVPVVLTASSTLPNQGNEPRLNLNFAIKTAKEKKRGVFVAYNNNIFSPLNLKFLNRKDEVFRNWNLKAPLYTYEGGISAAFLTVQSPEKEIITDLLNDSASRLSVIKMYPGLPSYRLSKMFEGENPVTNVILELYAAGTGNMRNSDYSLKPLLLSGRKHNIRFYSTSQQECSVDFSEYESAANVWREGVTPMELLTTESVVALYFAACLVADTDEELHSLMESATDTLS